MKIYAALEKALKKNPSFVNENGVLKKWVVISKAQSFDEDLIMLLFDDSDLKENFFLQVKEALVFNQKKFIHFLEQKNYLNDSYTIYKNKIGLKIDGKFLSNSNEVVLVWPFKDCVLEGGQSKDEQKRDEIFFNEVLAQDEISQLLDSKVFTNAKRFSSTGEQSLDKFNRNIGKNITDNLLIRGNNLLALHSLKLEYTGKVKLVYIDPPFNTDSDSFRYNDSFSRSTWLTFMKNRLAIAKTLLRDDGFICCHIDNNEGEYLKVLMDEIFGEDNYLSTLYIRVRYPDKTLKQDMDFHKEIETIHVYRKSKLGKPKLLDKETTLEKYVFYFEEKAKGNRVLLGGKEVEIFSKNDIQIYKNVASNNGRKEIWATGSILDGNSSGRFFRDFLEGRYKEDGYGAVYKVYGVGDEKDGFRYFTGPQKAGATKGKYFQSVPTSSFDDDRKTIPINNYYDLAGSFGNCRLEGGVELRSGKKPEELLRIILQHFSEENDIVLDYHLGSGTTCAVAHKLNRQYIGLEQLDYGSNDAVTRLKNVINGDPTGISKHINWKGGGGFIYLELKKYNQIFVEDILNATNYNEILKVWNEMKEKSFINYNVELKKQNENFSEFQKLSLNDQKKVLIDILDKNHLYVNYSSLNDKQFNISDYDKRITRDFYQFTN